MTLFSTGVVVPESKKIKVVQLIKEIFIIFEIVLTIDAVNNGGRQSPVDRKSRWWANQMAGFELHRGKRSFIKRGSAYFV